jgi:hypothetical protein
MKLISFVFLYLPALLIPGIPVFAQSTDPDALKIEVTKISAVNADQAYSSVIDSFLSEELNRTGEFILIDRKQSEGTGDSKKADIDKVIMGNFVLQEKMIITVMSIDTATSHIDISITRTEEKNADLQAVVREIAGSLRKYYSVKRNLSRKFDITVKPSCFAPLGYYSKYLHPAYGILVSANAYDFTGTGLSAFVSAGAARYTPRTARYDSVTQLISAAGPAYRFRPANPLFLSVKAGAGAVLTRSRYDVDGIYDERGFSYRTKWFSNACGLAEAELSVHITERWMLAVSAGYLFIKDKSRDGSVLFAGVGVKTLL